MLGWRKLEEVEDYEEQSSSAFETYSLQSYQAFIFIHFLSHQRKLTLEILS